MVLSSYNVLWFVHISPFMSTTYDRNILPAYSSFTPTCALVLYYADCIYDTFSDLFTPASFFRLRSKYVFISMQPEVRCKECASRVFLYSPCLKIVAPRRLIIMMINLLLSLSCEIQVTDHYHDSRVSFSRLALNLQSPRMSPLRAKHCPCQTGRAEYSKSKPDLKT